MRSYFLIWARGLCVLLKKKFMHNAGRSVTKADIEPMAQVS